MRLLVATIFIALAVGQVQSQTCGPLSGSVQDDPHFIGFYGQKFEFQGHDDGVFNILSTPSLLLNAHFFGNEKWEDKKTFMDALVLRAGEFDEVSFTCEGTAMVAHVDGNQISAEMPTPFANDGLVYAEALKKKNSYKLREASVTVEGFGFHIFRRKNKNANCYLNVEISYRGANKPTEIHGLVGQTMWNEPDASEQHAKKTKYWDGTFTVEGTDADYELLSKDLRGTDFNFNKFTGASVQPLTALSQMNELSAYGAGEEEDFDEMMEPKPKRGSRRHLLQDLVCHEFADCIAGECVCQTGYVGDGVTSCSQDTLWFDVYPASTTVECDAVPSAPTVTAETTCPAGALTNFAPTEVPGACTGDKELYRTWNAVSLCGDSISHTQTLTVADTTAPVVTVDLSSSVPLECDADPGTPSYTVTDNCDSTPAVTVGVTVTPGSCPHTYEKLVSYLAVDDCGNTQEYLETFSFVDTTPPMLSEPLPVDIGYFCREAVPTASVVESMFDDNCSPNVTATVVDNWVAGMCYDRAMLVRTFEVSDACGNTAAYSQNITVNDIKAPIITKPPEFRGIVAYQCASQIHSPLNVTAVDNCGYNVPVVVSTFTTAGSGNSMNLTRYYTASDDCNNSGFVTEDIMIQDSTPPTFTTTVNPTESGPCTTAFLDGYQSLTVEATDNCGTVSVSVNTSYDAATCTMTVHWTATDAVGQTTVMTQVRQGA